jgi:tyrosinase
MLHHSNVDRLIAMWQAVYYNESTMSSTTLTNGAFGSPKGNATPNTPLKPFFLDTKSTFHTSRTAAETETFGYTYPEINDWSKTKDELRDFVINRVNVLYGDGPTNVPKQNVQGLVKGRGPVLPSVAYTAEVQVERSEVPLPCSIDVRLEDHTLATISLLGMPLSGMVYSSIPLRDSLKNLSIKDMLENALVPYLQKNLRVEVRKVRL